MLPIFDRLAEGTGGNFAQGRRFEVENGHQNPDNGQGSPGGADCPSRSLGKERGGLVQRQVTGLWRQVCNLPVGHRKLQKFRHNAVNQKTADLNHARENSMNEQQPLLQEALAVLAAEANRADAEAVWPVRSWEALRRAGVLEGCVPKAYGGQGLAGLDLLEVNEALAGACVTTCFILSQRDAAIRRVRDSGNNLLCQELLPPLAHGERFATVGLSQLTTSRQHGQPSLVARRSGANIVLEGTIPWVTGAAQADHFIIGAVLEDGQQILAALPRDMSGVSVGPPLELMALQGSLTAEVRCQQVMLDERWLLAGPAERVLNTGRGGTGSVETSCLALGLTGAALAYLNSEATTRPELRSTGERLEETRQSLRREMHRLAQAGGAPEAVAALRARVNTLVLHATQAALTASKGTGFLRSHPAQRWARQALFFLVWSCPRPAAEATLAYLSSFPESECP